MAMFGWMTIMIFFIVSMFMPLQQREEMKAISHYDAADSERLTVFSYSNYVRDALRKAQELKAIPADAEILSVVVHGRQLQGGASGLVLIDPTTFTTDEEGSTAANSLRMPYLAEGAHNRYNFGNICVKDGKGRFWLYSWTKPSDATLDATVKTSLSKDRTSRFYIKDDDRFICAGSQGETRTIEGGEAAADLIPDGAIVVISQPIEHGPTG